MKGDDKNLSIFVWIFISCLQLSVSAMTIQDYQRKVTVEMDRRYAPINPEMCQKDPGLRNLKSCILDRYNKNMLKTISDRHMSRSLNYWRAVKSEDDVDNPNIRRALRHTYVGIRSKRSAEDVRSRMSTRRSKRDIPGNPCSRGKAKRTTVLFGVDAITGVVVELFLDPERQLYQTFFTRKCSMRRFFSFLCEVQYVEYMTAVYKANSFEVIVRPVKIPTGCAISVG